MPILAFDTETSGLPDFRKPSDDPSQPHLVELGMTLEDDDGTELSVVSVLIRPDGWTIEPEAYEAHGISQEMALAGGIPERMAVELFLSLLSRSRLRIAHNLTFDDKIMRSAILRSGTSREAADLIREAPRYCTMIGSTKLLSLPPTEKMLAANISWSKNPSLTECLSFFFGTERGGAHSALSDARNCMRVFRKLEERGLTPRY